MDAAVYLFLLKSKNSMKDKKKHQDNHKNVWAGAVYKGSFNNYGDRILPTFNLK